MNNSANETAGNFHLVFKGLKYIIPLAMKCPSIATFTSKLGSFFLVQVVQAAHFFFSRIFLHYSCIFSLFGFLHLHVQPYLFLSYLMIIFYVLKKLYVLS